MLQLKSLNPAIAQTSLHDLIGDHPSMCLPVDVR